MDSLRMPSPSPSPTAQPTNDDIEAVIQMATSARPSPDGRTGPLRDTRTQLFVGNLPYRVRWQDLKDLFRRAGTVLRADVSLGPDNRSRGYGTVLLATAEDAGRAIDMFNGYSWQTRILEVRPDRLPPDFDNPLGTLPPPPATSSVPQGSLTTPYTLAALPASSALPLANVSDDLDYSSLYGQHDFANNNNVPCRNLFVGNLPFHCQWQDLKDLFRQAGTIIRADVALGADGRSRGFGTVVFANELDADRAVRIFNGYEYNGRVLKVHYDKFSQAGQPATPASPARSYTPASVSSAASPALGQAHPTFVSHPTLTLPIGYQLDYVPPSGPGTPHELFPSAFSSFQPPQQQQQQLRQQTVSSQSLQQPQSQSRLFGPTSRIDIDSLADSFAASTISTLARPSSSVITSPRVPPALSSSTSSASSASASAAASPSRSQASISIPSQSQTQTQSPPQPRHSRHPSQRQQQQQHHLHPHHPGPITLPPPPQVPFPGSPTTPVHPGRGIGTSLSPSHYMGSYQYQPPHLVPNTPHGLPPITPSMPPFTFLPPPVSPHHHPSQVTPTHFGGQVFLPTLPSPGLSQPSSPLYPHPLIGAFSPGVAMSPGTFWGRPGTDTNPFINPAVGAPVHVGEGYQGYFYVSGQQHHQQQGGRGGEPKEYFDPAYFPVGGHGLGPSGLANEILKEKSGGEKGKEKVDSSPSEDTTEDDSERTRCSSVSTATSWTQSEEGGEVVEFDAGAVEKDHGTLPRAHSMNNARPVMPPQANRAGSDPTATISTMAAAAAVASKSPVPWRGALESPASP